MGGERGVVGGRGEGGCGRAGGGRLKEKDKGLNFRQAGVKKEGLIKERWRR